MDRETVDASVCRYCGLPLPAPSRRRAPDSRVYCCYGCRIAESITQSRGEEGFHRAELTRLGVAVFFSMNVIVFSMALWPQQWGGAGASDPTAQSLYDLLRYLSLLFSAPVLFLLGEPLAESGWAQLVERRWGADLLLLVGVAASFGYSAYHVVAGGHVYFEVGCAILVLVTLGKCLEASGKLRTGEALRRLTRLLPDRARVVADGVVAWTPTEQVAVGSTVLTLPGESIPCDGRVLGRAACVDEQILTGESRPRLKEPGDQVFAGSIVVDADLTLEVLSPHHSTAVHRMIEAVRRAADQKGRWQRLADRTAAMFLPAVSVVAVAAFAWHSRRTGLESGISAALAVLLVACPCALGLATPMAAWASMGAAAARRVLFQSAEALERLAEVQAFFFDKTGTLSTGRTAVDGVEFAVEDQAFRENAMGLAGWTSQRSTHPSSVAVHRWIVERFALGPSTVGQVRTVPGLGLETVRLGDGAAVLLGSLRFLQSRGAAVGDEWVGRCRRRAELSGDSMTALAVGGRIAALFVLQEQIRGEAAAVVGALKERKLHVAVLTGDVRARGEAVGRSLGVPVLSELLPEEKAQRLGEAQARFGSVAMVGDGINDAPALAASAVGIAMGCGADVSRAAADVCLAADDLAVLPWLVDHARATVRVMKQNLVWAFAYNVLGVAWAAAGALHPIVAALAMVVSSVLVVANSLRLGGGPAAGGVESSTAVNAPGASAERTVASPASAMGGIG